MQNLLYMAFEYKVNRLRPVSTKQHHVCINSSLDLLIRRLAMRYFKILAVLVFAVLQPSLP